MAIVSNNPPQPEREKSKRGAARRDRTPAHREPRASDVMAEAQAIYRDTFDTPPDPNEIAAEAYAIYLARGGAHGSDQDDWLEAERRIKTRTR